MAGTGLYKEILVLNDGAIVGSTTNGETSRDPPFSLTSAYLAFYPSPSSSSSWHE